MAGPDRGKIGGVIEIADAVIAHAVQLERSYGPPVLELRIDSPADRGQVADRARAAIAQIAGEQDVFWSVDDEPAGVIVRQWGHASDIGATLSAFSRALDVAGVSGRLEVHAREPAAAPPLLHERREELLECHLRVRGERRLPTAEEFAVQPRGGGPPPEPVPTLFPDDGALLAGIETALAWIGDSPSGAQLWFGNIPHRDVEEVRAEVAMSLAGTARWRLMWILCWEAEDRFRLAFVKPESGDVSLVEGGARLADGDWEPAYSALLTELRAARDWASYGLIKRGRQPALAGRSLLHDWVPALHYGSNALRHHIYEDVLAPDAFGAQLLGPGYAGRIPQGRDWEGVDLGNEASLLLHRDPAAWFGEPLPAITESDCSWPDPPYPTPEVISRAREDLADILITADILRRAPSDPLAS